MSLTFKFTRCAVRKEILAYTIPEIFSFSNFKSHKKKRKNNNNKNNGLFYEAMYFYYFCPLIQLSSIFLKKLIYILKCLF